MGHWTSANIAQLLWTVLIVWGVNEVTEPVAIEVNDLTYIFTKVVDTCCCQRWREAESEKNYMDSDILIK